MTGAACLAAVSPCPAHAGTSEWIEQHRSKLITEYVELLTIPNVSSDLPNVRRNADHVLKMMEKRGLKPRLLEGPRSDVAPAVYGEWIVGEDRKTIVLYAHYDGQPAAAEGWKSNMPFKPVLRTARIEDSGKLVSWPVPAGQVDPAWRIYARSAADDKAGVMAILAAVEALRDEKRKPAYNVKIFFDGEEEVGSPNMPDILARNRKLLMADGWVVVDGPGHPSGPTQVVLGVRGVITADITIHGPIRPLHSGHYGNWAPNPALMLSQLLASMKDPNGRVLIDGFYDDVVPLTPSERAAIAGLPSADVDLKRELGLARTEGNGRPLAELIHEPSLNIDGIRSAEAGEGARNVVPSTATATIDMRLVKGNDPKRQLALVKKHIERQGYTILDREPTMEERRLVPRIASVINKDGYAASRTPLDHPFARQVVSAVKAIGPAIILPSTGGSLPLSFITDATGAPTVTVSPWNFDNNQHAEDENIRLSDFFRGVETVASVLTTAQTGERKE